MREYPRALSETAAEYAGRIQRDNRAGRCFICDLAAGKPDPGDPIIYRDEVCVVFFPVHPRLLGYALLAPLEHRTGVVGDSTEDQYLQVTAKSWHGESPQRCGLDPRQVRCHRAGLNARRLRRLRWSGNRACRAAGRRTATGRTSTRR